MLVVTNGSESWSLMECSYIDDVTLNSTVVGTRWCKLVLIKVNVLLWHIFHDKIPISVNLENRNIDLPSVLCLTCGVRGKMLILFSDV